MSGSVDVHTQLASIIDRFAKCALLEMTKIIDKDSALLRAEISRRQMEVEALLCKLQFAESELRSARQAAASRQPAPSRRSVAIQVNNVVLQGHNKRHSETHVDNSSAQSAVTKENGSEPFHVKEEQTEMKAWDSGDEVEETPICWEEKQHSPNTSGVDCVEAKPSGIWDSPDLEDCNTNPTQRPEASRETTATNSGHHSTNVSPNGCEEVTVQFQQAADCDASTQNVASGFSNSAVLPAISEHRRDGVGAAEKSSRCAQCGKTFTTRFYLKIHQRIHTGERPYTCLQCGKRFYCNSHLISHQRCHTGEKPYSCEECGKSYSHLNSLKLHQRSHTEGEVYNYW